MPLYEALFRHTKTWSKVVIFDSESERHAVMDAEATAQHIDPVEFEQDAETWPSTVIVHVRPVSETVGPLVERIRALDATSRALLFNVLKEPER